MKTPKVGALDATAAEADVEAAVYAILDFVDSLNATVVAVSHLDFYTNAEVNGSLLLDPDCPYNVTFEGEEATAYLGRPWLALPTVSAAAAAVVAENANSSSNSSSSSGTSNSTANSTDWTDHTTISPLLTPWQAGGSRQSFGRQGGRNFSRMRYTRDRAIDVGRLGEEWSVGLLQPRLGVRGGTSTGW